MSPSTWRFDAIGTAWDIDTDQPLTAAARTRVDQLIEDFDVTWSRFRDDSMVSKLAPGGIVPAPPDAAAMFSLYTRLDAATAGAVNPLVGASLESLGYGRSVHAEVSAAPAPSWRDVLGWEPELALTAPAIIDVGAVGKGRLVDLVFDALRGEAGLVVNASGDMRTGERTLRVALEHPYDPSRAIGIATVTESSLCGSATNRRVWGDGLHHVLDARTGAPVETVVATWALHAEAMIADGLATTLFFPGGEEVASRYGASWVRMFSDGRVQWHDDTGTIELFS